MCIRERFSSFFDPNIFVSKISHPNFRKIFVNVKDLKKFFYHEFLLFRRFNPPRTQKNVFFYISYKYSMYNIFLGAIIKYFLNRLNWIHHNLWNFEGMFKF